jgi:hypothetical protein
LGRSIFSACTLKRRENKKKKRINGKKMRFGYFLWFGVGGLKK